MQNTDLVQLLTRMPLFHGLSGSEVSELAQQARERTYSGGAVIFFEGDDGDVAYIVVSGSVDITLADLDGNQIVVYQVQPGGYFGEMALLDGQARSATAIAAKQTHLVEISRSDLLAYLRQRPDAAILMLASISERLRLADQKIKALSFQDVGGRLARSILDLSQRAGESATIYVRHDQLADMVGSRRPTVSTLLNHWREAGYVSSGRGQLTVLRPDALEELAAL